MQAYVEAISKVVSQFRAPACAFAATFWAQGLSARNVQISGRSAGDSQSARDQISSCSIGSSPRSIIIEWRLHSNQMRNACRSRSAGHADGTLYQPSRCSSKISVQTSRRHSIAFLLAFALRQQVDRGFEAQIVQCQLCTRRINPVKPIQKGLCWFNNNCGTVDRLHTVWSLKLPCGGSSSTTLPNARAAGWLRDSRDVGGPA